VNPNNPIIPPPSVVIGNYPVLVTIASVVAFTAALVWIAKYFDPTQGPLTISIVVVLAFVATVVFCLLYTIPNDEITSAAAGGLVAAFGAVVAFWLGRPREPPKS
jgi:4-amino-4-deoxy-L-arabinose transferase-like glycosyltransferase